MFPICTEAYRGWAWRGRGHSNLALIVHSRAKKSGREKMAAGKRVITINHCATDISNLRDDRHIMILGTTRRGCAQGRRVIRISEEGGALVCIAPNKPKYKPKT